MKKSLIIIISFIILLAMAFVIHIKHYEGTEIKDIPKTFNYDELGIAEYEYPNNFDMDDSLKRIIASLAFWYEDYDEETSKTEEWKNSFIARFIQNSMFSFDYLDDLDQNNDGRITAEQINYIHYSITNTEVDYSNVVDGYINCRDNTSFMNHAFMDEYEYEIKGDHVIIRAIIDVEYQGSTDIDQYDIVADLIKNPYSCFNGYSIVSVKSKELK